MPTNANNITHDINIGRISEYLSRTDIIQKLMRNENVMDEQLPVKIRLMRKAVEIGYTYFNSTASLDLVDDYMLALCGQYRAEAETKLGNATGIIVGTGNSNNPNQLTSYRKYPQFEVGDAGAKPMGDGDNSLIIFDAQAAPGWVNVFVEQEQEGEALAERVSWTSVWELGKITLTWNQGLGKGTLVNIEYPITTNLTASQSSTQDLNYYATLNGAEIKSLLSTSGQIFLTPPNTLSVISFTLFCSDAQGERLTLVWRGQVFNDGGTITVVPSDMTVIGINDFGDDFFNNIVVAGDDSFQGLRVTLTGITDKIINCVAKFRVDSTDL